MRITSRRSGGGFTLIEMLIALALTGIILTAAGALLLGAFKNEASYRQQNSAQMNARRAADYIADDMKGAKRVTSSLTVNGVSATYPTGTVQGIPAGSTVTPGATSPLYFNIFDDNGAERRVRYWLNGTDLRREIVTYVDETTTPGTPSSPTGGVVVARNVSTFTAQKPYDSLNPPNYDVVRIVITTAEGDAAAPWRSQVTVRADVTLRNDLI